MQPTALQSAQQKKSTNLSINSDLLRRARAHKINLSRTLEERLTEILKQEERKAWRTENAEAIGNYNARIEKNGVFSDGLRSF
ncbi:MAG: type II toxin-antitoxin system CcdA family antitoxin [Proteobacteria bacterium]|nr:type II toxin-antitoxin system CcdA family antitoxin [Pseudomonadota bacterium]